MGRSLTVSTLFWSPEDEIRGFSHDGGKRRSVGYGVEWEVPTDGCGGGSGPGVISVDRDGTPQSHVSGLSGGWS